MKPLSQAKKDAILLLEIQDDDRGWVSQMTLASLGVHLRTLRALLTAGLLETSFRKHRRRVAPEPNWRLTGQGERLAAKLKSPKTFDPSSRSGASLLLNKEDAR